MARRHGREKRPSVAAHGGCDMRFAVACIAARPHLRHGRAMTADPPELRRGWTTGACATAATWGALERLWGGAFPDTVRLTLPRGETPVFSLRDTAAGPDWAECGVQKDAGDDPDVTHGAVIIARVRAAGRGVTFRAGDGVGTVTKPGLPIPVGDPAINPVPRRMMTEVVAALAERYGRPADVEITIRVPGGAALARKTWNPRLGIAGGLSILGTTGVVRPFSCAAWIASIHRGIDVAVAAGLPHVAGCTGATSERVVQALHGLPDHAMLDMGDFAGGLLKYLAAHPVPRITIGGGIGKMTKLAQGARDLHSRRSQVDFAALGAMARAAGLRDVAHANTALEAVEIAGPLLAERVAAQARDTALAILRGAPVAVDVVVIDRAGAVLARTDVP
jgi:cobalt-precorrin-5B (C1)-methyltransferase